MAHSFGGLSRRGFLKTSAAFGLSAIAAPAFAQATLDFGQAP
ncbi:MAG: twin-arginine translocation signal domain-containing protein [Maritimibacter sp.]|nr:twin-arginine translocation signal domain-containing protein [Maritimibacter sp.]